MKLNLEERIHAFSLLGSHLSKLIDNLEGVVKQPDTNDQDFRLMLQTAKAQNPWFTSESCNHAFRQWAKLLTEQNLSKWMAPYSFEDVQSFKVGVVNAGNIPLVGLHDLLSVVISGNIYIGKNASDDSVLLPYIVNLLKRLTPELADSIRFVNTLTEFDAVIATGNNNSSRYFEHYFARVPHIIRKNRNGIAILNGEESREELIKLGDDIFRYFGLGCRNVSKLYVPESYNFDQFFQAMLVYQDIMVHNKYMNNFDYNNTVYLLKIIPFLQNGFLIVKEDASIPSPIAVVHYERYSNPDLLTHHLIEAKDQIQCIVTASDSFICKGELKSICVNFGKAQDPQLEDYADGVDTIDFLSKMKKK